MSVWRYSLASVVGTSHLKSGTRCQDHSEVATIPAFGTPDALILVASDGAGSASRSDEGARAACTAFLEFSRLALDWVRSAQYLTDGFGNEVLVDLQQNIQLLSQSLSERVSEFACTLLGGLVTSDAALFVQVGDGAIVYRVGPEAQWCLAVQGQRGEFVNETIFITRGDASRHVRAIRVNQPVYEVALMTDGIEFLAIKQPQGEPHAPFFEHVLLGLRRFAEPGEARSHNLWIEGFLRSQAVSKRTDDDKTLILATRARCPQKTPA